MAKLVLLDGHSLAYRAYFALPQEMATQAGEMTNASFGFARMLLDVLDREEPDYIAVSFDVGRTWRHDRYEGYKGHRAKSPDELRMQVERIKEMVQTFNIPIYTAEGWEADDVIGTLANQGAAQGVYVVIVTGDTDAHQLVTDKIMVQSSGRAFGDVRSYDPDAVRERYGLEPRQLPDYKAILGDKSDNIPGVAGIGEKGASQLLQTYDTLEGVFDHLGELKPGVRTKLEGAHETAFLSRELATIQTAVPGVMLNLEASRTREFDRGKVRQMFRDLEFRSLLERIPESDLFSLPPLPEPVIDETETDYRLVSDESQLAAIQKEIEAAEAITLDTETGGLEPVSAPLVGIAIGVGEGKAYYLPIAHRADFPEGQLTFESEKPAQPRNLELGRVTAWLNPLLERKNLKVYAHNGKFDLIVLAQHGIQVPALHHDTLLGAWILNPGSRALGLKSLAQSELGVSMTQIEELIGRGKSQITMDLVDVAKVAPYAAADVDITCRLVPRQIRELTTQGQLELFQENEMPLVKVLAEIESNGVLFDQTAVIGIRQQITSRLHELEQEIYRLVGFEFNMNSPQQLSDVLFDKLALDKRKSSRTSSGHFSTAVQVLEKLRGEHPIVELIMEQRGLQKLLSTYVDQLPAMINPQTGRIHTDFSQTAAETGRLSSNKPNLQNIPVRTEQGREIRKAFIAPPGHILLAADYSQVELRVLAHLSGDKAMTDSFLRGEDIHAATATKIYGVALNEVSRDQRRVAKIINFGLLYGMSAFRLAREASINYVEADRILRNYFESFPSIQAYLNSIVSQVLQHGYAETILGRRRYFEALQTNPTSVAGRAAERAAKNHPIQGSAAEIIKIAMIRIDNLFRRKQYKTRMVLQVHDELLFEMPEDEYEEVTPQLVDIMEGAMTLSVPLKVDAKAGQNWAEMHEV